jgi:hypothetical protein
MLGYFLTPAAGCQAGSVTEKGVKCRHFGDFVDVLAVGNEEVGIKT